MLDLRGGVDRQTPRITSHPDRSNGLPSPATPRRAATWLVFVTLLGFSMLRAHSAAAETVVSTTAVITAPDGLNLRSGPSVSFPVITVMPGGAMITVTGSATPDNWLPVQYSGMLGWADGTFCSIIPGTPVPAPQPVVTSVTVLPGDGLNLRSGPGSAFGVITVLPRGTSLTVTGAVQNSWLPVTVNGASGWVDAAYVSSDGSSPMITANAASTTTGATVAVAAGSSAGAAGTPRSSSGPGTGVTLAWPNDSRRISTVFSAAHLGVDIDQYPNGSRFSVGAAAAGTVTFAGGSSCCSYGLYVIIDHGNGLATLYAHFSSLAVQQGQAVSQGQKLGLSGCTGTCTGDHIHFEVRVNGTSVDPLRYLPPPWTIE